MKSIIDDIFKNINVNKIDKDTYDKTFLKTLHSEKKNPIVIYGVSRTGLMALCGFENISVKVDYFIDDDLSKNDKSFYGIKNITPEKLSEIDKESYIFISHDFFDKSLGKLLSLGFKNIYSCVDLFYMTDFGSSFSKNFLLKENPKFSRDFLSSLNPKPVKLEGWADLHYFSALKFLSLKSKKLIMTNVDFCITERCSMKCKECSNLMQYYENPKNTEENTMIKSMDILMNCVDELLEARVFGGDPFMNKEMYKYVNKLQTYKNIKHIPIYTNAVLMPKGENLECLKNSKVRVHITDYGSKLTRKKEEVINYCIKEGVNWDCDLSGKWETIHTKSGKIENTNETPEVLKDKFSKCCLNNLFQVLHGKVYKCPFSAHGTNMRLFPSSDRYDFIDLLDKKTDQPELKKKLYDFYHSENFLTACGYCPGRGSLIRGEPTLEPAIQTKKYLPFEGERVNT